MVNVTEITNKGGFVLNPIQEASSWVQGKIAELGYTFNSELSMLLTVFVGAGLVWVATKVGNKIAKMVMILVGVLLVAGVGLSFL